jgi:phage host-nuclease inhibitor protein Gam
MRASSRRQRSPFTLGTSLAVLAAVAALAAGCGGGSQEAMSGGAGEVAGDASSAEFEEARDVDAVAARPPGGRGPQTGTGGGAASRPLVSSRAVIRRGQITLVTKEMDRARTRIDDLLARHGGYLASEDTSNDRAGRPERSVLVLRVPEPAFDTVMTELTEVGRTKHAERTSEDVTSQVIDVESRVATQEASLARLQRFLRQATDVDDMIRVESEIAERQASLESLLAQQKYLRDHTTLSTVTVRLRVPDAPAAVAPSEAGFLVGLVKGWEALQWLLVAGATVAGAVLPFLLAVGAFAVPVWLLARRRRPVVQEPPS